MSRQLAGKGSGVKGAAPPGSGRLAPDQPASGHEPGLEQLLNLPVLAQQAAVPQRGLKDVVERDLDPFIGYVVLTNEAEDSGIERRDVPFPFGKGAFSVLRLFVGDLWEGPRGSIVDDIIDELIEITADARAHPGQQHCHQPD
jgi:hypothetical protein